MKSGTERTIKEGSVYCPLCSSDDCYQDRYEVKGKFTYTQWHCDECNGDWIETTKWMMWEEGEIDQDDDE